MQKEPLTLPDKLLPIEPLTHREIHEATQERVTEISREFTQGFRFLERFPKSVTFFGSTRVSEGDLYYDKARNLAKRIVKDLSYAVITGGGPGIMEAANRGAKEVGGHSVGLTIRLPKEQVMNNFLTEHIDFYYFFSRKVCLTFSAEAFLFFPGGFGTLDEFFEIITLLQTHKVPMVPVVLVGSEYWQKIKSSMLKNLLERKMIDKEDLGTFTITDNEDEILSIIRAAPVRTVPAYTGLKVNPIE